MSDQFLYVQAQDFSLAGAGAIAGATSITLKSFKTIDGALLTMSNFGTIGFGTLEPDNGTQEEQISFTGVSQNANGTATLTGVYSVLFISPYTQSSGLAKTHPGSSSFIISNTAGFYDKLTSKNDDETITGVWTFTVPNYPQVDNSATLPTLSAQLATKAYVDSVAIAGAPKATDSVYGITRLSVAAVSAVAPIAVGDNDPRVPTQNENDALVGNNTAIAVGSGNLFVTQTGLQKSSETYGATATGNDTYVVTLSPVPTSYDNGRHYFIKVDVGNTGSATVNFNGLGAINIVTGISTALVTGDMVANGIYELIYNSTGTVFQLVNPSSAILVPITYTNSTTTKDASDASATQNIAHGLGKIPKFVSISCTLATGVVWSGAGAKAVLFANTFYNGTTQSSQSFYTFLGDVAQGATFTLNAANATATTVGVVTFDATNIIITWTKTGSPTGVYNLLWRAEA